MKHITFNMVVEKDTQKPVRMVSQNLGQYYPGVRFVLVEASHDDMDTNLITVYGENLLDDNQEAKFVKSFVNSIQNDDEKTLTPVKTLKFLDVENIHDMKTLISKRKLEGANVKVLHRNFGGRQSNPLAK